MSSRLTENPLYFNSFIDCVSLRDSLHHILQLTVEFFFCVWAGNVCGGTALHYGDLLEACKVSCSDDPLIDRLPLDQTFLALFVSIRPTPFLCSFSSFGTREKIVTCPLERVVNQDVFYLTSITKVVSVKVKLSCNLRCLSGLIQCPYVQSIRRLWGRGGHFGPPGPEIDSL